MLALGRCIGALFVYTHDDFLVEATWVPRDDIFCTLMIIFCSKILFYDNS